MCNEKGKISKSRITESVSRQQNLYITYTTIIVYMVQVHYTVLCLENMCCMYVFMFSYVCFHSFSYNILLYLFMLPCTYTHSSLCQVSTVAPTDVSFVPRLKLSGWLWGRHHFLTDVSIFFSQSHDHYSKVCMFLMLSSYGKYRFWISLKNNRWYRIRDRVIMKNWEVRVLLNWLNWAAVGCVLHKHTSRSSKHV